MKSSPLIFPLAALCCATSLVAAARAADAPPTEWIDSATGHKIVQLSSEPWSFSFYFHQNGYSPDGDRLVFATPSGLSAVDLKTRKIEHIVDGRADQVVVSRKTPQVFYVRQGTVYATRLDTLATREIAKIPPEFRRGSGLTVNADDTLLAGSLTEANFSRSNAVPSTNSVSAESLRPGPAYERKSSNPDSSLEARWASHVPMRLYTIDIQTGEFKTFLSSTDWLNHVQFSPTDPKLLMFCHEGPWHKVDRIWTIRNDGTGLRKIHTRTMDMEIAGHEFFSADGKTIWYDLQTPKGREFWLAGLNLETGEKVRYPVPRDEWSVHYNTSRDGKLFCGDGGGPRSVAAPGNGQWLYLFTPEGGKLKAEKLVDLSKHDYDLEPNATFTPDGKWIVFRSNMHGPSHVYAVEIAKSLTTASQ
ncbi:MAG TPA: oligogalacturonate lyase family protein [Verrucomicrobiae bacterium]|nr:oligogalacturonate lyase family protein [Verrucomicrobiae bacterium]